MALSGSQITRIGGISGYHAYPGFSAKAENTSVPRTQIQDVQFSALYLESYDPLSLYQIFSEIENQFNNGTYPMFKYAKTYVAPDKPQDGQTYYADGTNWNPGSGEGIYTYYNSTWNKLG